MKFADNYRPVLRSSLHHGCPTLLALFLGSTMLVSQPALSQTMVDGGIIAGPSVGTLDVTPSGADITPISGVAGINFATDQEATLNSDTGDNKIVTSGADGIRVTTWGGDITINHRGEIQVSGGRGVYGYASNGGVTMDGTGDITASQEAILADPRDGDAIVSWTGNLTSTDGTAVTAFASRGNADFSGSGTIRAETDAVVVDARGIGKDATLDWTGDIHSTAGRGAYVHSSQSNATVKGSGSVFADSTGFYLDARGDGAFAKLEWTGNITSTTDRAAYLYASNGSAVISGEGNVHSSGDAFTAEALNYDAAITWSGKVESTDGRGLFAFSPIGSSTIIGSGSVSAKGNAIQATTKYTGAATVHFNGKLKSETGRGIDAYSAAGATYVEGSGYIKAAQEAIFLESLYKSGATLIWDGVIKSNTSGNAVHLYSVSGDVNTTTTGAIFSTGNGIYAQNHVPVDEIGDPISVNILHMGLIDVDGTGVHAKSVTGSMTVGVIGMIDAGQNGILAESLRTAPILVEHEGYIRSGAAGIRATGVNGTITINQSGRIKADTVGIYAKSVDNSTILIEKTGSILAYSHGIEADSSVGKVTVNVYDGDIRSTAGHGILATNNSDTNTVTVDVQGDVTAALDGIRVSTSNSAANVTLSMGTITAGGDGISYEGWGAFTATIEADGEVIGGLGQSGISISDSSTSVIANYGIIRSADGFDGSAIHASRSQTTINNYGLIQGNVTLEPWTSSFNNYAGARFESGTVVDIGSYNYLTNDGRIAPGGDDRITTTHLIGSLRNNEGGRLAYDIDMANNASDRIDVDGVALLKGALGLRFMSYTGLASDYTVLTADGYLNADELTLSDFVLGEIKVVDGGDTLKLDFYGLDMVSEKSSERSQIIGDYFNRRLDTGDQTILNFVNLVLDAHTAEQAEAVFDVLTPAAALEGTAASLGQVGNFSTALLSCPLPSGIAAPLREGTCDWARLDFGHQERDNALGWSSETELLGMSFGMQRPLGDGQWHFGFAGGTSFAESRSTMGGEMSTTGFNAGVALKYAPGPFKFSAALNGNWGDVSSTRTVDVGGTMETLVGDTSVASYNLRMRSAYLMGSDSLYFMPMVDVNASHVRSKAYAETGGSAALAVDAMSDTIFSLTPAIEFGTHRRYADGGVLRAFASVGATFNSQAGVNLTSALASDLTGVEGFTLSSGGDKQVINLSAGISAFQVSGWTADARIGVSIGDNSNDQQASVKLRKSF